MKKAWQKKEQRDAKAFNGKKTIRSGGLWFSKGDIKSEHLLIECKTTEKNSYSIKSDTWEKISKEAVLTDRVPVLSVEFGDKKHEVVIISTADFIELLEAKIK